MPWQMDSPSPVPEPTGLVVIERLEDARQHLGSNARTGVAHLHRHAAGGIVAHPYGDLGLLSIPLGNGLRGVHQQVEEDLPQPSTIGEHLGHGLVLR